MTMTRSKLALPVYFIHITNLIYSLSVSSGEG